MLQLENKGNKIYQDNIVQPDDGELLDGAVTLVFNPGAHFSKVANLRLSLAKHPDIKTTSSGGGSGKGSWIRLVLKNPQPLFQTLYHMPDVLMVARKGKEIQITIL